MFPSINQRYKFELKNLNEERNEKKARACFEVSSVGELEQVWPIILSLLEEKEIIEVIYCSCSLEKKIQSLKQTWTTQLKTIRVPLVTYIPGAYGRNLDQFITANELHFCRYDFFPELLLLRKGRKCNLYSATLIGKTKTNWFKNQWKQFLFHGFDKIFCVSKIDKKRFESLGIPSAKLVVREFRIPQIIMRQQNELKFENSEILYSALNNYKKENRIIFGSCWPVDLELLDSIDLNKNIIVLAPHNLDIEFINNIKSKLNALKVRFALLDNEGSSNKDLFSFNVIILKTPGVLCELYKYFGHAYIGGGYGRSIHSVLEPFLGGANVYCGPKVHRSTEIEVIQSINDKKLTILSNDKEFKISANADFSVPIKINYNDYLKGDNINYD